MSAKDQKWSGGVGAAEGLSPRGEGAGLAFVEPTDDELNALIDRAVREAEKKLAGTPVVSASHLTTEEAAFDEPSRMVH